MTGLGVVLALNLGSILDLQSESRRANIALAQSHG
jgi:hypothetical protein